MTLIPVYLVKCLFQFDASSFQFDLHQWQTIDKDGYIVPVFVSTLHCYLSCNLKLILAPVFLFQKFKIQALAIVPFDVLFFPEYFGFVEHRTFAKDIQRFVKLFCRKGDVVVLFQLGFQVGQQILLSADGHIAVTQLKQLFYQVIL